MLLYKYLNPDRFDVLANLKIRFTPILSSALNDPFECTFVLSPAEKDIPTAQQDDFALESWQAERFRKKFSRLGVLCLSKVRDNLLMWGHYCKNHSGFVIGFDGDHQFFHQQVTYRPLPSVKSVKYVLDIPGFGTIRDVKYSPERLAISNGDHLEDAFFMKSSDWSYEKEVRIFRNLDDADTRCGRDQIHLFTLPPDLIRQVIVGVNADPELCSRITSIASGSMLQHVNLLQAELEPRKYGLRFVPMSRSAPCRIKRMKFTQYFQAMRSRPDRPFIKLEWIQHVIEHPVKEVMQQDCWICRWAPIDEVEGRYLRVILLPDGETVHNAFFDRRFRP